VIYQNDQYDRIVHVTRNEIRTDRPLHLEQSDEEQHVFRFFWWWVRIYHIWPYCCSLEFNKCVSETETRFKYHLSTFYITHFNVPWISNKRRTRSWVTSLTCHVLIHQIKHTVATLIPVWVKAASASHATYRRGPHRCRRCNRAVLSKKFKISSIIKIYKH